MMDSFENDNEFNATRSQNTIVIKERVKLIPKIDKALFS